MKESASAAKKPPPEDFDSDREEKYFNIGDDSLNECDNMISSRAQVIKTFKPGNTSQAETTRHLPDTTGY